MASLFSGVTYWMGSTLTTVADMPQDPVYTYTAANVIDGLFTYQSSARKTRFTTAMVTWNDPANSYKQAVEYVADDDAIARYGIQPTEFVAFGCTSQGQAHRRGLWAITTSQYETDSVTFAVGLDGLRAAPGQYIRVQDPNRAGKRQGGRISAATANSVTVDRAPDEVAVGDTLTVHLPDGTAQTRVISNVAGRVLSVTQAFSNVPVGQSIWTVESESLQAQTFRILNVSEDSSEGEIKFTISAVQHNASKFAHIDNGAQIQTPPISKLPTGTQKPPTDVSVSAHVVVEQGIANNVMTIAWTAAEGASTYKVEWQKDNGQWIQAGTVSTTSVDVIGIYTGTYIARVTAFNSGNTPSLAALSVATALSGKTGEPPRLSTLTAASLPFGIALDWTFPPNTADSQRTEIWASTNAVRPDVEGTIAYHLGDYAYPGDHTELHGLAAGASLFFWGRIVDKAGNVGGWYPEAGAVNGQSISDPDLLQDYWKQTIGRGALQASLLADIDAAAEYGQYVNAPEWAAGTAYAAGTIVGHASRLWRAAQDVPAGGAEPGTNPAAWEDIGDIVQTAYGQAASIHDATLKVDELDGQVQSVASQVDALEVTAGTPVKAGADTMPAGANTRLAGIYTYSVARVDGDLAEAIKTETLTAQVSGYSASIQTIQQAQATLDGKVSASYVMKVQVAANGQRYMAGIALGVDYSGGDVSSQVLVNAGTFAVINATDGSSPTTYPFVIQGGQVFISQALIGTGWIQNAMIGDQIKSNTNNSAGLPTWEINKSGTRYVRGNTFTITEDSNGWRMTNAAGVVVVEMGVLN
jgi:predicted phage tail protein